MNVTPEMIAALATLRRGVTHEYRFEAMAAAIDTLDNAGVFAAIDEATGYDVDPLCGAHILPGKPPCNRERKHAGGHGWVPAWPSGEARPVSKCTCLAGPTGRDNHHPDCSGGYTSKVPGWGRAVDAQRKMNEARGLH